MSTATTAQRCVANNGDGNDDDDDDDDDGDDDDDDDDDEDDVWVGQRSSNRRSRTYGAAIRVYEKIVYLKKKRNELCQKIFIMTDLFLAPARCQTVAKSAPCY